MPSWHLAAPARCTFHPSPHAAIAQLRHGDVAKLRFALHKVRAVDA